MLSFLTYVLHLPSLRVSAARFALGSMLFHFFFKQKMAFEMLISDWSSDVCSSVLTRSLPLGMTVASGLNAIAHCMEGLYAVDGNPIVSMMAEEGIRSLYESLPRLAEDGGDDEARTQALYGCWLAGLVLGSEIGRAHV